MLQFTQPAKRRGLFGSQGVGEQQPSMPGMGDPMSMDPGQGFPGMEPPAEAKRKTNWGGIAADFLAGLGGREGPYLASLQAEQDRAAKAREYQQRRSDDWSMWQRQQDYKRANPDPVDPYRFEDNAGNGYERGADGQNKLVFTDPNDKTFMNGNQVVNVPNVVREQQQRGGAPQAPTPAAADYLRRNPALKADFDAKYGPGSADRILGGGGVSNGTGGFPY